LNKNSKATTVKNNFGVKRNTQGFDKHPENINKKGYPAGQRNRSTVVRHILDMKFKLSDEILETLKENFPGLAEKLTVEEVMTIIQVRKSIVEGDTAAYRAVQDSAYGQPKQEVIIDKPNITAIQFNVKR